MGRFVHFCLQEDSHRNVGINTLRPAGRRAQTPIFINIDPWTDRNDLSGVIYLGTAGLVQPGKEKNPRNPWCDLQDLKRAHKKRGRDFSMSR